MASVYEARIAEQTESVRQIQRTHGKIVVRKFGAVAKLLWPFKTAAHLATIAGCDPRTAERWLSGEYEPPISVVQALLHETFRIQ